MRKPPPNALMTRADLAAAFLTLEAPLLAAWRADASGPDVGLYRARYSGVVTRLETVARYVWGLAPFAAGGGASAGWPHVLDAIVHGTDPQHPDYWGPAADVDQRSVEMAAFGVALRLVPEKIWEPLAAEQKDRFADWLRGMLDVGLVDSNWQFFRLMVTLGLRHVGRAPANVDAIEQKAIEKIDALYLADGWYYDGGPDQRDYYIPWAFHFYSLTSARLAERGPVVQRLKDWTARATLFAQDFAYWFSADGAALPFGRSLTYRFAQAAFWGGCGLADLAGHRPGEQKGFLLRNLRWWWKQPFLNDDGTLSLGYAYPNLNMLEPYNAAGSPYWAFKAFAALQLPASHPFWAEPEMPVPAAPGRRTEKHPRFVIDRDPGSGHVVALSAGQWHTWPLRHRDAKYAKFAYSTFFGPCVGANHEWLAGVGLDSTLAVMASDTISESGLSWQNHGLSTNHQVADNLLISDWATAPGVIVRTWLLPLGAWHVRVHRVTTDRVIQLAEGGFAAEDPAVYAEAKQGAVCVVGVRGGLAGVIDLGGNRAASICDVEPNSSLYFSRVRVPMLVGRFEPGTHWVGACVLGAAPGSTATWEQPPVVEWRAGKSVTVTHGGQTSEISFTPDAAATTGPIRAEPTAR